MKNLSKNPSESIQAKEKIQFISARGLKEND